MRRIALIDCPAVLLGKLLRGFPARPPEDLGYLVESLLCAQAPHTQELQVHEAALRVLEPACPTADPEGLPVVEVVTFRALGFPVCAGKILERHAHPLPQTKCSRRQILVGRTCETQPGKLINYVLREAADDLSNARPVQQIPRQHFVRIHDCYVGCAAGAGYSEHGPTVRHFRPGGIVVVHHEQLPLGFLLDVARDHPASIRARV